MARKPITIHPDHFDSKVLDILIASEDSMSAVQIAEKMDEDQPNLKTLIASSLKWLSTDGNCVNKVGKGPGTKYENSVDTNSLQIDEEALNALHEDVNLNRELAKKAIRAVFNTLEPGHKISAKDAIAQALEMFPNSGLTEADFLDGTTKILAFMAKDGELQTDGQRRGLKYFRGKDKFDNVMTDSDVVEQQEIQKASNQ